MTALAQIFCLCLAAAPATDRVTLSNGETLEGRIVGVREGKVRVEMRIGSGRAELACEIARIARIHPGAPFDPAALAPDIDSRIDRLRPLWAGQAPLLAVPGADAGRIGLALAQALLDAARAPEALPLLELLAGRHPDVSLRQSAEALRVQALAKQGRLDEALELARRLGGETDDPSAMAFASLAKGRVEAGRTNLDEAIDHFLRVSVLFPDLREEAAQGLWEAAQIEQSRTNSAPARRWLETISIDYSNTAVFARAAEALAAMKSTNTRTNPQAGSP